MNRSALTSILPKKIVLKLIGRLHLNISSNEMVVYLFIPKEFNDTARQVNLNHGVDSILMTLFL